MSTPRRTALKVPVGTTSVAGYGTTVAAFATSLGAFLSGDRDENTIAGVLFGVMALASFVATQVGRFWQARELARADAQAAISERNHGGTR